MKLEELIGKVVEVQFFKEKPDSSGGQYVLDKKRRWVLNKISDGFVYFLWPFGKKIVESSTYSDNLIFENGVLQERKHDYSRKGKGSVIWCSRVYDEGTDEYDEALKMLEDARVGME
jgi:hypothetical protein